MRLIQLLVEDERRSATLDILDDNDIDYAIVEEAGERQESTLLLFPIPTEAVDELLDELREDAGIQETAYTVVTEAETATTEHIDELEERYAETDDESDDTLPKEELVTKARALNPNRKTYYAMTFCSTIIATAGLLRNSPEAVVGAMVIAPFFGTALAVAAGACCDEPNQLTNGLKSQFLGVLVAVVGSAGFAVLVKTLAFVPPGMVLTESTQYTLFMTPGLLSVGVALVAGAAGGFALATSLPVALAGVAIAAAITPSAAALGIAIAWGNPVLAAGAFVLLAVNVAAVNIMAAVVLRYLGYKPNLSNFRTTPISAKRVARTLALGFIVLFVIGTTVATAQQVLFARTVHQEVHHTVSDDYKDLKVADISTEYNAGVGLPTSNVVTVTVIRTSDKSYPKLAKTLERRIDAKVGGNVAVQVKFTTIEGDTKS